MRFFFLFLLSLPCWATLGTPIQIPFTDRSGVNRVNEAVEFGIAIQESAAILDVRNLMIGVNTGTACSTTTTLNSHLIVTRRWHGSPTDVTKKIAVVLTDFLATVNANSTSLYCLSDRVGVDPGGGTQVTVTVDSSCSAGCVNIATGAATFQLRGDYFNDLDSAKVGATTLVSHSTAGGIVACIGSATIPCPAGNIYTSASAGSGTPAYSITVEQPSGLSTANEAGENIRAQVLVTGALWNAGTTAKYRYRARLIVGAGETRVKRYISLSFSEDMTAAANLPSDIAFVLPTALSTTDTALFGTAYGNEATTTSLSVNGSSDSAYVLQYEHGNTYNSSAYLCNNQPECSGVNEPGFRLVKNTTTQTTGNQSDGWVDLNDATNHVTMYAANFWQNYPGEIEVTGTTLKFHGWPLHGDINSDLTNIYNWKYDRAIAGITTGFSHVWPYAAGSTMSFNTQLPKAANPIINFTNANPAVVGLNVAVSGNFQNNGGNCPLNSGCTYWVSGTARREYFSGCTSGWSGINGYRNLTFNNTFVGGWPQLTITGFDSTAAGTPNAACMMGEMEYQRAENADGVVKTWELWTDFGTGAGAPGNAVSKMRDRLYGISPAQWSDTSWVLGRMHARDSAADTTNCPTNDTHFSRAECLLDAAFNNMLTKDAAMNNYGSLIWGDTQGTQGGDIVAGVSQRYWAMARRHRELPWCIQFARTADPKWLRQCEASVRNSTDVTTQNVAADQADANGIKKYADSLNNWVLKRDGGHFVTHNGATEWFSEFGGADTSGISNTFSYYSSSEGQEPNADEWAEGAEAYYLLTGDDRTKERLDARAKMVLWEVSNAHSNVIDENSSIYTSATGRGLNGCLDVFLSAYQLTGTTQYLNGAEACFKVQIQSKNNQPWGDTLDNNPVGYWQANPGNAIGWNYFHSGWNYESWSEFTEHEGNISLTAPSFSTGSPASVNVQSQMVTFAKGMAGDVPDNTQTGAYSWQFPFKPIAYGYHYSSDTTLLGYLNRLFTYTMSGVDTRTETTGCGALGSGSSTGAVPILNCAGISYGNPDLFYWSNFTNGVPAAEYELNGQSPAKPSNAPLWFLIPSSGTPLTAYMNKASPGSFTVSLFFDAKSDQGGEFEGDPHPKSGDIVVDFIRPDAAHVTGYPKTTKTPNLWWPPTAGAAGWPGGGPTNCGAGAPIGADPPTITYQAGKPNGGTIDNRYQTFTIPEDGLTGEYQLQVHVNNCTSAGYTTIHDLFIANVSLGNYSVLATNNVVKQEVGSGVAYFNVPAATAQLKLDVGIGGFNLIDPNGVIYKQSTAKTIPLIAGKWGLVALAAWQDYTSWFLNFGGVKPLLSSSPATYWDSPSVAVASYGSGVIGGPVGPMTLTFGAAVCTFAASQNPLATATQTVAYSTTVLTNGQCASPTFTITVGTLPTGLTINPATGAITGTPSGTGTSSFTVHVADANGNDNLATSITVNPAPCLISAQSPSSGTVGVAYSYQVVTTGCSAPAFAISAGALPTGLTISGAGLISGTPLAAGSPFSFTVAVTDANGTPTRALTITIAASCTAPTITNTSPITPGVVSSPYSYNFAATGTTPLTWSASGLLSWETFDTVNGILSGTPTGAGTNSVSISVSNSCGSNGPTSFSLTIGSATGVTINGVQIKADTIK